MTYKELLELLQELDETQLNKQLTIWVPDNMPSISKSYKLLKNENLCYSSTITRTRWKSV